MTQNADKRIVLYLEEKKFIQWCIDKYPPFIWGLLKKEDILWRIHNFGVFRKTTKELADSYEEWLYKNSPVSSNDLFEFENGDFSYWKGGLIDMDWFNERYKIKVVRKGTHGYPTEEELQKGIET